MKYELKMCLRSLSYKNSLLSIIYHKASAIKTIMNKNISDEEYLKKQFKENTGKDLNLDDPRTFNEKLQWLKIYDRNPLYTILTDKYAVRDYIANKIGEEYLIPLFGVWERFEDIDFNKLPNEFVLKCNHDSGSVVLCKDKNNFNVESARKKLSNALNRNYYYESREWPYKNILPKIIAEKYMTDEFGYGLKDYKFFCFNGEPKFLYVGQGLTSDHSLKIEFYDMDWNKMPFYRTDYKRLGDVPRPSCLEDMINIAKILSEGIPFVRIDLYNVYDKIYFSEFTFSPAGGHLPLEPDKYNDIIGSWVKLSNIY